MTELREIRAWHLFTYAGAAAFLAFTSVIFVSIALKATAGGLNPAQTDAMLRILYWGCYPLVFVALGALIWHFVKTETGGYA